MAGTPSSHQRLTAVEQAFRSLPDRYLGADPGFDATYHVRLCDLGHTWEVRLHGCLDRLGADEVQTGCVAVGERGQDRDDDMVVYIGREGKALRESSGRRH